MTNKTITLSREHLEQMLSRAEVFDDGGDGADAESARSLAVMLRAALAEPVPAAGNWAIDTTAGRPILVYQGCSVIEAEQAYYVLGLINGTVLPAGRDDLVECDRCPRSHGCVGVCLRSKS